VRSRLHWFLQTALIVALLTPLLSAHGPQAFVALLLETAVVAVGFRLFRARPSLTGEVLI
jgi:hypothetical protein